MAVFEELEHVGAVVEELEHVGAVVEELEPVVGAVVEELEAVVNRLADGLEQDYASNSWDIVLDHRQQEQHLKNKNTLDSCEVMISHWLLVNFNFLKNYMSIYLQH